MLDSGSGGRSGGVLDSQHAVDSFSPVVANGLPRQISESQQGSSLVSSELLLASWEERNKVGAETTLRPSFAQVKFPNKQPFRP